MIDKVVQIEDFPDFEFGFEPLEVGVALVLNIGTQPRLLVGTTREEALMLFQVLVESLGVAEVRARLERFAEQAIAGDRA